MNATLPLIAGLDIVLDLVGATGTVVSVDGDRVEIRWNRSGKSFWYGKNIAYRLIAA